MAQRWPTQFNNVIEARWVPPANSASTHSSVYVSIDGAAEFEAFQLSAASYALALKAYGMDLGEEGTGTLVITLSENGATSPILTYESKDSGATWAVRV